MPIEGYGAFDDPYLYKGTKVLKNRLGIRDPAILQAFEVEMSSLRAEEPLPVGYFDAAQYRKPSPSSLSRRLSMGWPLPVGSDRKGTECFLLSGAHPCANGRTLRHLRSWRCAADWGFFNLCRAGCELPGRAERDSSFQRRPVSYTHLDVYKRQDL